jgi:2,7-dihydroxy-5-methyl-1-naphthoate 7-O-methyltransferase
MAEQEPVNLWALSDLQTPWCLHVVATLRIAEHVAAGTTDIADLAAAAGCDADSLHGVLSHLATRGVFAETTLGSFKLNEAAQGLLDPSLRIGLDLDGIGGRMAHAWGTLLTYARTGASGYPEVFGAPFWQDLDAHPEIAASFDALMGPAGHGAPSPDLTLADGWDGVRTVVDVGGGTGALLAQILRARPTIEGTLVDLPRTVARSVESFAAAGVAERVTTIGQSFFDPLPAGADLYLLMKVLNDWPDREAIAILRRCAEAARPSGRVLVSGGVSADDEPRSLSIDMVLLGTTQRPLARFRDLAGEAGLVVVAAGPQGSVQFMVECRPT